MSLFNFQFFRRKATEKFEASRYSDRARSLSVVDIQSNPTQSHGLSRLPIPYRTPYIKYESLLDRYIQSDSLVMELASGTGEFTKPLISNSRRVFVSDLSTDSLVILQKRYPDFPHENIINCSMCNLPFDDNTLISLFLQVLLVMRITLKQCLKSIVFLPLVDPLSVLIA